MSQNERFFRYYLYRDVFFFRENAIVETIVVEMGNRVRKRLLKCKMFQYYYDRVAQVIR